MRGRSPPSRSPRRPAAELRDRLRRGVRARADDRPSPTIERQRCRRALDDLDGAAIGTLHSFAQRILAEHPIEAGLPPLIEVLDEVASSVAFERAVDRSCARSCSTTPTLAEAVAARAAAGVTLDHLRSLARGVRR